MAKQNLNAAIRNLPRESPLVFRIWRRPFQLDPSLSTAAIANPGTTKSVAKRDRLWLEPGGNESDMRNLQFRGQQHNVSFSFDGAVTNTRDSLRLVLWAQSLGRNEQLMTALGWRHFRATRGCFNRTSTLECLSDHKGVKKEASTLFERP